MPRGLAAPRSRQPRRSTCDRFEPIGAGGFPLAVGRRSRVWAMDISPWRTAHDPLEGRAEGAFGFIAERQGDGGNGVAGIRQEHGQNTVEHGDTPVFEHGDTPVFPKLSIPADSGRIVGGKKGNKGASPYPSPYQKREIRARHRISPYQGASPYHRIPVPYPHRIPSDKVRARLQKILAEACAAQAMPWEPTQLLLYRTIFPQMANCLPKDEGAQLRFLFEEEIKRFEAA